MVLGIVRDCCVFEFDKIIFAFQTDALGMFISNYPLLTGTFMDGDSDKVCIMMHASSESVFMDLGR